VSTQSNRIWHRFDELPVKTTALGTEYFVMFVDGLASVMEVDDVITLVGGGGSVGPDLDLGSSGTAGSLDVFPSTAAKGKLSFVAGNSAGDTTTTVTNASQAGARTYTIPDAGASTTFVMAAGASTIAGVKTFTSVPVIDPATGTPGGIDFKSTTDGSGTFRLVAADSAGDTVTTVTHASQAGARTYTIPDAGASASFVMTAGAQTIAGAKTFSSVPIFPAGGFTAGSTTITEAAVGVLDGVTPGTAAASKALVMDASNNMLTGPNIFIGTTVSATTLVSSVSMRYGATSEAAAGSVQGDATATAYTVTLVTGADGTKGVILGSQASGYMQVIINNAGSALKVYPQSSGQIDALGVNVAFSVPANKTAIFFASSTTQWWSMVGA
jgi:hypothetical protein